MANLYLAREAKDATDRALLGVHGDMLDKAANKINEAALRGEYKTTVYYGKEMTAGVREWVTETLRASGYKVTSNYHNQYNETTFTFDISWN